MSQIASRRHETGPHDFLEAPPVHHSETVVEPALAAYDEGLRDEGQTVFVTMRSVDSNATVVRHGGAIHQLDGPPQPQPVGLGLLGDLPPRFTGQ
jgi:hypothetical protein